MICLLAALGLGRCLSEPATQKHKRPERLPLQTEIHSSASLYAAAQLTCWLGLAGWLARCLLLRHVRGGGGGEEEKVGGGRSGSA